MKRFVAVLMVLTMVLLMMACSKEEPPAPTFPSEGETSGATEGTSPTTPTSNNEGSTKPSEEPTEKPTEKPSEPPVVIDPSEVDISKAKEVTSIDKPAKFGEWVKSTRYAPATKTYETIYWRVIATSFDCKEDVERYNSENHSYKFADLEEGKVKYCKVTYQVYFPEEFPVNKEGIISSCILPLNCDNPKKGYVECDGVIYTGLGGSVTDVTVDKTGKPGEVFTGEGIYLMLDDPKVEYGFWYMHRLSPEDEDYQFDYLDCK